MRITHYLYNTFLVEEGDTRVAIDPGQYFYLFDFRSLIPEDEWPTITHIVITHGDPDHHWQSSIGVGFQAGRAWDVALIYRHLEWDTDSARVIDDINFSGSTLGVIFRW